MCRAVGQINACRSCARLLRRAPMTQTKTLAVVLAGGLLAVACTSDQSTSDEGGSEGGYSGTDNNSGGPDEDDGGSVEPTYPTQHPKIYIEKNRARLKASLDANSSAAS